MASIHTHPRSPFWMAHFVKNGRRTTKSTRIKAEEEGKERALQLATAWENAAAMAGEGRDGRQWVMATLNEMFGEQGLPVVTQEVETWDSICERWLAACQSRRGTAPSTLKGYTKAAADFGGFLGGRRRQAISTISQRDVDRWVADMLKRFTPGTAAVRLQQIRTAFNWAMRQEIVTKNPAVNVERPSEKGMSRSPFTLKEVLHLIQSARREAAEGVPLADEMLTLLLLGVCVGARIGDCSKMKWANVDLKAGCLSYLPQKKQKGGQVLTVSLVDPLLSHLKALPRAGELLCPTFAGWITSEISLCFTSFLGRAGITGVRTTEGRARAFNDKTFHALRHTLASMLAEAGVDDLVRRRITGHEDKAVAAIYQHVSVEATGRALNQVLAPLQEG